MRRSFKLLFLSFLLASCSRVEGNQREVLVRFLKSDGTVTNYFKSEVAETIPQHMYGLMYRKSMPADRGMLFIFEDEIQRSFWMKNTYIYLDMIFVNSAMKVDSIVENAAPHTEIERKSKGIAKYVLEINGGLSSKLGIKPGDKMELGGKAS